MGKIVTITSGKGGVGKSTTTANLSSALATLGKKVVAVDFDIGLRNLDMILGLENRVVYDVVDVMEGNCNLAQAVIKDKKVEGLHFIPASQTKDKTILDKEKVRKLLDDLKKEFDYILIDSPAGIESGFEHAIFLADTAIIVITPDISSVRDADRVVGIIDSKTEKAKNNEEVEKFILINKIKELLKNPPSDFPAIKDIITVDGIRVIFEDGWGLIRASNTTPKLVTRFEAIDEDTASLYQSKLLDLIK